VPQPGVVTIVVQERKAEFVVVRPDNLYEKPLTEWPAQCYAAVDGSDSNPIGHTSRKYGAKREVRQIRLETYAFWIHPRRRNPDSDKV